MHVDNKLIEINECEVCGSKKLDSVLDLGLHPMCDDLVRIGEARLCVEYPIEILFCKSCNTAHQRFQIPKHELFPKSYHYRSRFTKDVLEGMKNLVDSCNEKFGNLENKLVLDIGCNDGSLLDFFRERGANTVGIEPTDASEDALKKKHIVYKDFFSKTSANLILEKHGKPDLITFTNVFAHIEDLAEVLEALKLIMGTHTLLVIENHYLGSVLKGNQFDTFYHEHPRTYSYTSFLHIAKSLVVDVLGIEFPSRYGGNIRVFMGSQKTQSKVEFKLDRENLLKQESYFYDDFFDLKNVITQWKIKKKDEITSEFLRHGKMLAKAFPGRAAILVKLLELDENQILAVYEKPGSMKIGHYVPGTRIPIVSDDELKNNDKHRVILNMAWHIKKEIKNYLAEFGFETVIDVFDSKDFYQKDNYVEF